MSLNITVTKKILETIVHETFSNFGFLSSSSLLDSLKLLGFYYSTNAGISINIEDLKTPQSKKYYIQTATEEINKISQAWSEGIVSDQERFQSIIDSWNIATESMKNRIVEYYQDFDPANNLYIMAFSGARGNMSQVRQLVGMRGLMSDQEGKIIDLPIQANFREGLSSIDYIISSYGARKGIVDTALKTADSGYLTRRLIYLAQDLIIRETDCGTKKGILVLLEKKSSTKDLIGRQLLSIKENNFPFLTIEKFSKMENPNLDPELIKKSLILDKKIIEELKTLSPIFLKIKSSLTCQSHGSICQNCYGWDLSNQKLIALGETVGIIAAQSIGEPGTQLTMRTFHTGGIFTGELLKQLVAPFSGKLIIPDSLKTLFYRTNHGVEVLKLQQEANLKLINWKGIETNLFLEIGSYLYISKTTFIYKGQLISEFLNQSIVSAQRKLKPIYNRITGKVIFKCSVPCFKRRRNGKTRRILLKQSVLWIASGKILRLPIEASYISLKSLKKGKAIAKVKIITPIEGILFLENSLCTIITEKEKIKINFSELVEELARKLTNSFSKIIPVIRNYQYVDKHTVLAFLYIYHTCNDQILSIENVKTNIDIDRDDEKQERKLADGPTLNNFFVTTRKDIWKLYGPLQPLIKKDWFSFSLLKIIYLSTQIRKRRGKIFNKSRIFSKNLENNLDVVTPIMFNNFLLKIKCSGLLSREARFFREFQHLEAICLPTSTILNFIENELVLEKQLFATLVNYTQQTDDIVQGLPKIEELIEARKPKLETCLAKRPGIFLKSFLNTFSISTPDSLSLTLNENNEIRCLIHEPSMKPVKKKNDEKISKNEEKRTIVIAHSLLFQKMYLEYENTFFEVKYFSPFFKFNSKDCYFENIKTNKKLELSGKKYKWEKKVISKKFLTIISNFLFEQKKQFNSKEYEFFSQIDFDLTKIQDTSNFLFYEASNDILIGEAISSKNDKIESVFGKDYIFEVNEKISLYLKHVTIPIIKYVLPTSAKIIIQEGEFIDIGEPINEGIIDSHELLNILFMYHKEFDGIIDGTLKSLNKFQLILANSIQSIYQAQGVNISSKHIEIIVRQMTSKVIIKNGGDTPFLAGDLVSISLIFEIYNSLKYNTSYKTPSFEPKLFSATNSALHKDGFLSAAGFQETRKVLTRSAIEGTSDWLRGLKESIMSGRIIPAGSAFLNYKNHLDNLYFFKK